MIQWAAALTLFSYDQCSWFNNKKDNQHPLKCSKQKTLLDTKSTKARLTNAKNHLEDPQDFWGLMRQQQQVYIGHKMKAALHKKNIIPTVRHVGSVMACLTSSGPERFDIIDGTTKSPLYQKIQKENIQLLIFSWVNWCSSALEWCSKAMS